MSRLGRNCLVSVIVDGTRWRWPSTNTIHFMAARDLMPVDLSPDPSRRDTIQWAVQVMRGKRLATLAKKLSLTLSVYYIWAERNARWHNNPTRDAIQLSKLIIDHIRSRLAGLKNIKRSAPNLLAKLQWDLPDTIFVSMPSWNIHVLWLVCYLGL